MTVNEEPSLDGESLEFLAAYADGRLSPDERRLAETMLAKSEAAREVLAETIRLSEAEGPGKAHMRTLRGRSEWFWKMGLPLAAAAVLLLMLMRSEDPAASTEILSLLPYSELTARPGWDVKPWSNVRGEASATLNRASFRAGVLWTDFLVGAESDAAVARRARAEIAALLEDVPLSSSALIMLRDLPAGGLDDGRAREAELTLCETFDCSLFRTGMWTEAVRIWGMADGDPTTLAGLREGVRSIQPLELLPETRALLDRLVSQMAHPNQPHDSIESTANDLIRGLGR